MSLEGKSAIITGAARGIGRAIAERFAAEGAAVALLDWSDSSAAVAAIVRCGGRALAVTVDITDSAAVRRAVAAVVATHGGVDILVNNAGIIARAGFLELSDEEWRRVFEVNVHGTFNCLKAVVPLMVARQSGRIVNITSIAGKMGDLTAAPAYGASKGALNTLTKSLARQLAQYNITVNAVAPHAIDTEMSAEWSAEKRKAVVSTIPLGRTGRPEEVAAAALFLASDAASFITGEILDVNGGALMD